MRRFTSISLLLLAPSPTLAFAQTMPHHHATRDNWVSTITGTTRSLSSPFSRRLKHHASRLEKGKLFSVDVSRNGGAAAGLQENPPPVDFGALGKWMVSLATQTALIMGFLAGIDKVVARFGLKIPFYANVAFFYFFNLKTSMFSLLPNRQNEQQKLKQGDWEYNNRKRPSWTPPGFVFGIMWPVFVFGLRAFTAAMVVQASGGIYATPAIATLMLHLGFGSLWNTVNNIERRLGPSVIILYGLVLSKALAAFAFYQAAPLAGKLLALTLTWLTAAAALETNTWLINPDPDTGKKESLYPAKAKKWTTRFRWET